jgi:hypothetical protein
MATIEPMGVNFKDGCLRVNSEEVKVKFRCVVRFTALQPYRLIVLLTPKGVPSFISRGAAHQAASVTSASEGRNYRWNLANNQVIHLNC